jgi:hypothetical protein
MIPSGYSAGSTMQLSPMAILGIGALAAAAVTGVVYLASSHPAGTNRSRARKRIERDYRRGGAIYLRGH